MNQMTDEPVVVLHMTLILHRTSQKDNTHIKHKCISITGNQGFAMEKQVLFESTMVFKVQTSVSSKHLRTYSIK